MRSGFARACVGCDCQRSCKKHRTLARAWKAQCQRSEVNTSEGWWKCLEEYSMYKRSQETKRLSRKPSLAPCCPQRGSHLRSLGASEDASWPSSHSHATPKTILDMRMAATRCLTLQGRKCSNAVIMIGTDANRKLLLHSRNFMFAGSHYLEHNAETADTFAIAPGRQ